MPKWLYLIFGVAFGMGVMWMSMVFPTTYEHSTVYQSYNLLLEKNKSINDDPYKKILNINNIKNIVFPLTDFQYIEDPSTLKNSYYTIDLDYDRMDKVYRIGHRFLIGIMHYTVYIADIHNKRGREPWFTLRLGGEQCRQNNFPLGLFNDNGRLALILENTCGGGSGDGDITILTLQQDLTRKTVACYQNKYLFASMLPMMPLWLMVPENNEESMQWLVNIIDSRYQNVLDTSIVFMRMYEWHEVILRNLHEIYQYFAVPRTPLELTEHATEPRPNDCAQNLYFEYYK